MYHPHKISNSKHQPRKTLTGSYFSRIKQGKSVSRYLSEELGSPEA